MDLANRALVESEPSNSEMVGDMIDAFASMNSPSRVIVSFDDSRGEGTIIFEGAFRKEGRVASVSESMPGHTAVFYSTGGTLDYLEIATEGNQHLLFLTGQFYPRLTIYQYSCDVS